MQTSPNGRRFIEQWEGLYLQAYDDATGRIVGPNNKLWGTLTIGYGHTNGAGPPHVHVGMSITQQEADLILSADLAAIENAVNHLVKVPLTQNQFDALVSFQYNTDWLEHQHCSLLTALNAGNYTLADEDFCLYDRANGKILVGLDRRRAAEADLFHTPEVTNA